MEVMSPAQQRFFQSGVFKTICKQIGFVFTEIVKSRSRIIGGCQPTEFLYSLVFVNYKLECVQLLGSTYVTGMHDAM